MILLFALLAAISPRLVLFLMWVFNYSRFDAVFSGWLWPVLGFIFLPFTTLVYVFTYSPLTGLSGFDWIWLGLAVLLDLSIYGSASRRNRTATIS